MDFAQFLPLVSLSLLLLVLSLDNAVFISLLSGRLEEPERSQVRQYGLWIACLCNLVMLGAIGQVKKLVNPFITVGGLELTGKDLVLIIGGLILIAKATSELHDKLEGTKEKQVAQAPTAGKILGQILLLSFVFSIDSVLTAIGMAESLSVMIVAMVLASLGLFFFGEAVGQFVMAHPTLKVLALSFLLLIGTNLIVEGAHFKIPKGYTYFAMGFSVAVEMLNITIKKRGQAVPLHQPSLKEHGIA